MEVTSKQNTRLFVYLKERIQLGDNFEIMEQKDITRKILPGIELSCFEPLSLSVQFLVKTAKRGFIIVLACSCDMNVRDLKGACCTAFQGNGLGGK